jgi:hypothetical protein
MPEKLPKGWVNTALGWIVEISRERSPSRKDALRDPKPLVDLFRGMHPCRAQVVISEVRMRNP